MKLCKDCKHYSSAMLCLNPKNGMDPIDGNGKPILASVNRSETQFYGDNQCGLEAKNFEQKIEPVSWWRILFIKQNA